MANMFKETSKHVKPTSVEDTVKTDRVIQNLWSWASSIETLGMILFGAIIFIGIITAITSSFEAVNPTAYRVEYDFNWGMFFLKLVDCALYAFIEYCAYHIIALLVGALASITQNTKATAKLLEYQISENETPGENEWKCKNCGKINGDYVGTCSCGNTKAANYSDNYDKTTPHRYCENCGPEIEEEADFCPLCGTKQTSKVYR